MMAEGLGDLAREVVRLRLELSELLAALGRIEALLERVALSLGIRADQAG